jgi:2-dehydropantoate 2-reductase
MRIAVLGTGAVGGYFGGRLAEAGEDMVFVARGEHLRAIQRGGLVVKSIAGDIHIHPAEATDDTASIGPVDCVLVAVKAWQLPEAVGSIGPLIGETTVAVPLLNGVEAPDVLAEAVGREQVLGGLCGLIAFREAPGVIRHAGADPWITFGELDGSRSTRAQGLESAFRRARGVRVTLSEDIVAAMWEKFMFISSTGGVGAATRSPFGVFRAVPESRRLLEGAMREVLAVARAHGVDLPDDRVEEAMGLADGLPPEGTSSMQRDIMAGRRSELDAWNGAVVRLGRAAGVPTPVHEALFSVLLPRDLEARGDLAFPETPGVDK